MRHLIRSVLRSLEAELVRLALLGFLWVAGTRFMLRNKGFLVTMSRTSRSCWAQGKSLSLSIANLRLLLCSDVINANATDNSDLFHVLKGGSGSNFGVVTRFDVQAFKAGNLWGGTMIYPKSVGQQHIDAYHAWTENINNYPEGSSIVFWSYLPAMKDIVILAAYEDTAGTVAPSGFDMIMAIPDAMASTMRIASHKELTDELEQAVGYQ
jgi:hypothetical protein